MASALYPLFKQALLAQSPSIDFDADTLKVALVNLTTDYTYSAGHDFIDDVTQYSGTTAQTLGTKTVSLGVFDVTDDPEIFTSVAIDGSKTVGALVIFKDTGTPSTSPLIAYFDGFSAVTPNGGNITVTWDDGANKVFAL